MKNRRSGRDGARPSSPAPGGTTSVSSAVFHSDVLDEDRPYWVYLPASYEQDWDRRYPVVVILEGLTFTFGARDQIART